MSKLLPEKGIPPPLKGGYHHPTFYLFPLTPPSLLDYVTYLLSAGGGTHGAGEEDGVDDVDDAVGGLDVRGHHIGVVDLGRERGREAGRGG